MSIRELAIIQRSLQTPIYEDIYNFILKLRILLRKAKEGLKLKPIICFYGKKYNGVSFRDQYFKALDRNEVLDRVSNYRWCLVAYGLKRSFRIEAYNLYISKYLFIFNKGLNVYRRFLVFRVIPAGTMEEAQVKATLIALKSLYKLTAKIPARFIVFSIQPLASYIFSKGYGNLKTELIKFANERGVAFINVQLEYPVFVESDIPFIDYLNMRSRFLMLDTWVYSPIFQLSVESCKFMVSAFKYSDYIKPLILEILASNDIAINECYELICALPHDTTMPEPLHMALKKCSISIVDRNMILSILEDALREYNVKVIIRE